MSGAEEIDIDEENLAPAPQGAESAGGLCGRSRSSPVCSFLSLHENKRPGSVRGVPLAGPSSHDSQPSS